MAQYRESKTPESRGKRVHHLEVHPTMGGGLSVVHHYHNDDPRNYYPPKTHEFGPDEGAAFQEHMAKHTDGHFHEVAQAAEAEPDSEREMEEA